MRVALYSRLCGGAKTTKAPFGAFVCGWGTARNLGGDGGI